MKYLIVVVNSILKLAIGIIGMLFAVNFISAGILFFPNVAIIVSGSLGSNPSWAEWNLCPGLIPLFYIFGILIIFFIVVNKTVQLVYKADITKIIGKGMAPELSKLTTEMRTAYRAGRATKKTTKKEVKGE